MSDFHIQGAVPLDSEAYVARKFEQEAFDNIISGRWVLLLGPRQHGKTTGLVRIAQQLREAGLVVAKIDLQSLPPFVIYDDMLAWIAKKIQISVGSASMTPPEDQSEFFQWLKSVFIGYQKPVVVIIDEAANIKSDPFRNAFYGQIRAISSMRADALLGELEARITFLFAGTFRPESLVADLNSPFNVCQPVHTDDLTQEDAKNLAGNINAALEPLAELAYEKVGGQPFLLQTILMACNCGGQDDSLDLLDVTMGQLPYMVTMHLEGIFSKVIESSSLTLKVSEMIERGRITFMPADNDCAFLRVLGIAKQDRNHLIFRNDFYSTIARGSAQLSAVAPASINAPVFSLEDTALSGMNSVELREICLSSYQGAVASHRAGGYRLALVGYGSAMEALLLDFLRNVSSASLAVEVSAAKLETERDKKVDFQRSESETDPSTWRLFNMMKIARRFRVGAQNLSPNEILREWRNLVHPAVALHNYVNGASLVHESTVASGLFMILLRQIHP